PTHCGVAAIGAATHASSSRCRSDRSMSEKVTTSPRPVLSAEANGTPAATARTASLFQSARRELGRNGALILMCLPGVIVLFIVAYLPMPGLILAFKNYKFATGIWGSEWVGLKYFQYVVSQFAVYDRCPRGFAHNGGAAARNLSSLYRQGLSIYPFLPPLYLMGHCRLFRIRLSQFGHGLGQQRSRVSGSARYQLVRRSWILARHSHHH